MLDTKIITRSEIQKYKQLSNSSNNDKLNQLIVESQLQDLKPLLGERLFNAVLKDVLDSGTTNGSTYTNLLNGGYYTANTIEYYNPGLKAVISNYIYGRSVMWGDVIDNPFGASIKMNNNSKTVDYSTKKSFFNENKSIAYNIWVDVRKFLILTEEPLYKNNCSRKKGSVKIRKIGGNNGYNKHY